MSITTLLAAHKQHIEDLHSDLKDGINAVIGIDDEVAAKVVRYLVRLACEAQNVAVIQMGRSHLMSLPREWLIPRLNKIEDELLGSDPEWEGRRLLEVYELISPIEEKRFSEKLSKLIDL